MRRGVQQCRKGWEQRGVEVMMHAGWQQCCWGRAPASRCPPPFRGTSRRRRRCCRRRCRAAAAAPAPLAPALHTARWCSGSCAAAGAAGGLPPVGGVQGQERGALGFPTTMRENNTCPSVTHVTNICVLPVSNAGTKTAGGGGRRRVGRRHAQPPATISTRGCRMHLPTLEDVTEEAGVVASATGLSGCSPPPGWRPPLAARSAIAPPRWMEA